MGETSIEWTSGPDGSPNYLDKNANPRRTGARNPNWRGGRTVASNGYVLIRVGRDHPLADVRGYAYEHRLVAFNAGALKDLRHVVHHGDEEKQRNDRGNLEPLTRSEHRFRHRKPGSRLRLPGEINAVVLCACGCGASLQRFDTSGRPRRFISGHNMGGRRRG